MHPQARDWYLRRTLSAEDWPVQRVAEYKGDTTISVVLPALNEAATIGVLVDGIVSLRDRGGIVDEVVVVDSGSCDDTAGVARRAGANVFQQQEILPSMGPRLGKGEALWKAGFVTTGEIVVFIDSDLSGFRPSYVTGLVGPLLALKEVAIVKGFYGRYSAAFTASDGGRVTEILARPVLNALFPLLCGVVEPLSGLLAARRALLEKLPFSAGYGVDVGLLVDAVATAGIDALAQVGVGMIGHHHQDVAALGRMAAAVFATIYSRAAPTGLLWPTLTQFRPDHSTPVPVDHKMDPPDRPSWLSVIGYAGSPALTGQPGA